MALDALRGYLQLANGLTEVTRQRAMASARALLAAGEEEGSGGVGARVQGQVQSLTADLLATSRANREMLTGLVTGEVERAVTRLRLLRRGDLDLVERRVERLERRLELVEGAGTAKPRSRPRSPRARTAKSAEGTSASRARGGIE